MVDLFDDVDGTPAAETVTFALDGVAYAIELSADNACALRAALEPFVTGPAVLMDDARPRLPSQEP